MDVIKKQQKSLGEILVHSGLITREQLDEALADQKQSSEPLGKVLVRKGYVSEHDIMDALKGMLVVVVRAGGEDFGVEIIFAREILNYRKITPLPEMPPYILGMISLRDEIIPVISLAGMVFGGPCAAGEDSKIIVIERKNECVGLLVDSVIAVRNFSKENFEDMKRSIISREKKYIEGIIKNKGEIITLLKPEYFFSRRD
ncbi:MAG TPA: chemotaxis protein CheW [Candidatus Goldiibacteriota bacterium]|nr:chemotaxis protein CheW [Candidatus Goldiibacteriota bacterium]